MAKLVAAGATSHAFTLMPPTEWDAIREGARERFQRRMGETPPVSPAIEKETDEVVARRFGNVNVGLDDISRRFASADLDAVIIIGDDQNENFTEDNLPQLAIYLGEQFTYVDRGKPESEGTIWTCQADLSRHLYVQSIEAGFDVTGCKTFPDGRLKAHAIGPVLDRLLHEPTVPVVPIFVEAIHIPSVSPSRCYAFGQALRDAVESWTGGDRVAVCASGGLSHFTVSYPYQGLKTTAASHFGTISEDFDRQQLRLMSEGRGHELAKLTSTDLLENGEHELRSWITLLGMVGETKAEILAHEPFYRAIMGMGVAFWDLDNVQLAQKAS